MTLTDRDGQILFSLRRYFYLRTIQIRDLVATHDNDGSITRGRLRKLLNSGLIRRYQPKLVDFGGSIAPIFALTMKGATTLVALRGDASLALSVEPNFADWMSMNHFCSLSGIHILIDRAISAQSYVRLNGLYFEHEIVIPDAAEPSRKYRLHTLLSEAPRLLCCPDSAFELEVLGYRRAFYIEREMGSDTPARVAAKKCKGYMGFERGGLYRRHFPHARDMRVLWFCPNAGWRKALCAEMRGKPGSEHYLFVSMPDVSVTSILHDAIWCTADEKAISLVTPPGARPPTVPPEGASAGAVQETGT
jgi:hypothetical protein